ncbi:isochorismatase family protein [Nocardia sp. NPDC051981]|uniref:isochorismatase family protein n=1 Tax=Nocardia sp. NPDC051981 TaxID=3155417 RepID=UPI003440B357
MVRAVELARGFHEHSAPVVLVRVTTRSDGSDAAPGRNETPSQPGSLPQGWDVIVDDLVGHPDDITVTKRAWGAFYGTDLDLQLLPSPRRDRYHHRNRRNACQDPQLTPARAKPRWRRSAP